MAERSCRRATVLLQKQPTLHQTTEIKKTRPCRDAGTSRHQESLTSLTCSSVALFDCFYMSLVGGLRAEHPALGACLPGIARALYPNNGRSMFLERSQLHLFRVDSSYGDSPPWLEPLTPPVARPPVGCWTAS
jgi:hypothetical protein